MNHFYRTIMLVLCCFLAGNVKAEIPPLKADFFTNCADRTVSNTTQCIAGSNQGLQYSGYIILDGQGRHYKMSNGRFVESLDGTARLTGTWINTENGNIRFAVDIRLSGRTSSRPNGSPKAHHCLAPNVNGFYYYTHTSGTLSGRRDAAGAVINVARFGEAFQIGIGANITNEVLSFGASGWLMLTLEQQPITGLHLNLSAGNNGQNGDININLSGAPTACTNDSGDITLNCPNDITVTAGQGQNSATVNFSTPNASTTCMVENGLDCGAISNNISGFKYLGEYQGSKYYCSNTSDFTYGEAKMISMQNGGFPAVVCSAGENEFLRSSLLAPEAWIGFSDELTEGSFRWVNGENCNYTNWNNGEPNNQHTSNVYDHADHTILNRSDGKWYDRNEHGRYEFIMEIPCQSNVQPSNVTVSQIAGSSSGSNFQVGITTVTFEAIDECGNTRRCSFKVTVNPPVDPCANRGGDNDGDGVCADDDCNDNNPNIGAQQPQGTACNDGDSNTENDVIQADGCSCAGEVIDPCADKGGDNDGDGVCFDDDCNDFNASVGARQPAGIACDDGNPNTINDVIQDDGCGCFGLPRGTISIFCPGDIEATTEMGTNGTIVFYGQPVANTTCVLAGINIVQTGGPATGSVFPIGTTTVTYTVTDACDNSETCSFEVTVVEMVDPCADKGGDADGDGVCADDDCDDNNASIGMKMPQGTACNDGNGNTINDVIQADGCTCAGVVPDPCADKGGDADGDGVCADDDCDDNNASVGAKQAPGTACNDGNSSTNNDMIQSDRCTCAGTAPANAAVGDFVFRDNNCNGAQDDGEPGIAGVFVLLTNVNTGVAKFAVTGSDGKYLFSDVEPGDYTIKFAGQSNDLTTVDPGQGNDPTKDSDYDPINGITPVFTLVAGEVNMDIDGGFKPRNITPTCTADAGTLSGGGSVTIVAGTAPVSGTPNGDAVIPAGYSIVYVLTSGTDLVIQQTSATPNFTVDASGKYTVHTLIYDPSTLDLGIVVPGLTTGFDVNNILIQGGGSICASLDVEGAMTMVMDPMTGCPGNVTSGGSIGNNEDPAACGPFDPAAMFSLVDPSGGNGAIEYIWLASTNGCPTELVDQIPGATGSSYDPGPISQTTYYVRCSRTVGCTVWIESDCVIKKVDDCGPGGDLTCDDAVIAGGEGKINLSNIPANAKIEYNGPSTSWAVIEFCAGDCNATDMITGLEAGEYNVKIQSFDPYCYRSVPVTVTGGGNPDPCADAGGDSDGDGVCDNIDNCRNTANPDQADNDGDGIGNVCDDTPNGGGNTGTCDDAAITGGEGKINLSNIPANAIIEYNGPSTSWAVIKFCDGDCNSSDMITGLAAGEYRVKIQSFNPYCYRSVPIVVTEGGTTDPCENAGGDSDGDGVCDNVDNCVNTANPDQADNDGDGIGNVCDDTPNGGGNDPCANAGGDTDGDGVCDNVDNCVNTANPDQADNDGDGIGNVCDDTPNGSGNSLDCNDAVVSAESGKVTITNLPTNTKVEISGPATSWAQQLVCNGDCESMEMVASLTAGEYNVTIQSFDPYCYNRVSVTVPEGGNPDPCANAGGDTDGDGVCDNIDNCRNTANPDQADNDGDGIGNVCDDTPNGGGNDSCANAGGDTDGDGVCDNVDNCVNTANPNQADNDGDGIGNVCDDTPNGSSEPSCNEVVVSAESGKLIVSNLTAPIVAINVFDKNGGYANVFSCFNNCDLPMTMIALPGSDYLVKVQYYTANWGFNCEKEFDITVPGGVDPCANAGGDADGDGVCANDDCDDNNASVGAKQPQGTVCNDGNPDTENDVIQSDGCSCAGTPVGSSKCANRTVTNTINCRTDVTYGFYIVTNDLGKHYTFQDGLFMEFDDGTAMLTGQIINNTDNQIGFDVNINFTGRTQNSPTGAAKEHNCLHPDESTYYYYSDFSGTLMGTGNAAGAVLTVRNFGEAFQVGNGANVTNNELSFGASGWMKITVQSQPTGNLSIDIYDTSNGQNGDININLSGNGSECPNGASSRNGNIDDLLRPNASTITVYPNPAEEELFINLTQFAGKAGNIKIMNLYGQLVKEIAIDKVAGEVTRLDMSTFQNGLYHLTIKMENTQPVTKKVLVSRMY